LESRSAERRSKLREIEGRKATGPKMKENLRIAGLPNTDEEVSWQFGFLFAGLIKSFTNTFKDENE